MPEGKEKPYASAGHFYIRIGANSQQLSRDEIRDFFQKENPLFFDRKACPYFEMADFDNSKFSKFLEKAKIPSELPFNHLLKNLNLLVEERINNAGVLFFTNNLKKYLMNAVVICALFKGSEKVEIIDSKEYSGDFVSNFNAAYDYLLSKLNTNFIIKGKERTSRLEMPEEALREALINAMVHRDYFSPGHVQIDIFIDRVEISNPGRLLFDKEELGTVSIPRNPLIMDLAFRIDLVERVGSGIRRIRELCAEYGLRVDFNSGDVFRVVFHREKVTKKVTKTTQKTTQKSSQKTVEKTVEKILALIKENPSITSAEIQAKTGLTRRGIEWNLSELKLKEIIRRVGPDKGGHWEISKQPNVE